MVYDPENTPMGLDENEWTALLSNFILEVISNLIGDEWIEGEYIRQSLNKTINIFQKKEQKQNNVSNRRKRQGKRQDRRC